MKSPEFDRTDDPYPSVRFGIEVALFITLVMTLQWLGLAIYLVLHIIARRTPSAPPAHPRRMTPPSGPQDRPSPTKT